MSDSNGMGSRQSWPELILSARPFLGATSRSKETALDYLVQFSRPENSAAVVTAAVRQGVGAIAPMNDTTLLQALDLARAGCRLQVCPIIPNALGYVRDATDHGMIGAGLKHLRRLSLGEMLGIGLRGLTDLRRIMVRDFRALLPILIDVEMAAFKRFQPRLVLLHGQVTDIAVALGNKEALRIFADVVRRRFGAEPGLVTNNFGALLKSLGQWRIDIDVIVAPFNPKGFLMKPTKQVCEALLKETDKYIIADRIETAGADSLKDAFQYLRGLGIASAMVEIGAAADVDSVVASRHNGGTGTSGGGLHLPQGSGGRVQSAGRGPSTESARASEG